MSIVLGLESRQLEVTGDEIVIGRSPIAQVSLPGDNRLAQRHAILRNVSGRWLIEAQTDAAIRVGDGRPTKVAWLHPGDIIHLTEQGPRITFSPQASTAAVAAPVVNAQKVELIDEDAPIRLAKPIESSKPAPRESDLPPEEIVIPQNFALALDDTEEEAIPLRRRKEPKPAATAAPAAEIIARPVVLPGPLPMAIVAVVGVAGVLLVLSLGVLWMSQRTAQVVTSPQLPAGHPQQTIPSAVSPTPANDSETAPPPSAPLSPEQLASRVYRVLLSGPNGELTYRIGTAWAVDTRRLVTSGAVAQGIRDLEEQLPTAVAQDTRRTVSVNIVRTLIHPEFTRLAKLAAAAQAELNDLRAALEESETPDRLEEFRPKMIAAQDRLLDALQQQLDFDVAVLEADQDMADFLRVVKEPGAVRAGTSVRLLGMPFPMQEFLVDPEAPLASVISSGQLQAKVPDTGSDVRRWLVKFRDVKPGENWSGAAVINSQGEVIGVYSRPTPPTELREDYIPATHEITVISRLADVE